MRISWIFTLIILSLSGAIVALMLVDSGTLAYKIVWGVAVVSIVLVVVFYRNVMRP